MVYFRNYKLWTNSRERHYDEERSIVALFLHEVGDECNRLDGLAQSHLISEDTIQVVVVQGD